ncbi:MAG: hypothetical protein V3U72_01755 [Candidatus Aenigmarchaeota archaeon]
MSIKTKIKSFFNDYTITEGVLKDVDILPDESNNIFYRLSIKTEKGHLKTRYFFGDITQEQIETMKGNKVRFSETIEKRMPVYGMRRYQTLDGEDVNCETKIISKRHAGWLLGQYA